ncbi:DUF3566 domain-containing protein [Arthrobacter castelli]|uniref:DUF3566 domain-containing protein n=1 Tax=Arthrobacter castelli TaxID=271431 RepID=UPI0003F804FF|nr:DUF3566 domain-containing protein [Arthrobacter castelli]
MSTTNSNQRGTSSQARRPQPSSAPKSGGPAQPQQSAAGNSPNRYGSSGSGSGGQQPPGSKPGLVRPAPKAKVRRARLLVSKVDPWSVLKLAFLLSVALGIVTVVASIVLWTVLDLTGIFDRVNGLLDSIMGSEGGQPFDLREFASLGQVASFATIIAVVNVVLLTALAMLSAILYNISSTLVGGIGVTLTDD